MEIKEENDSSMLFVGKKFATFEELEKFVEIYERKFKQKFWIRSSRSVEAAKKMLRRPLNDAIKYYEVQYSCIHGGLEYKSRSKGIRRKGSCKMDCPAKIKLRATNDGNGLEIRSFITTHEGHDLSEDCFSHLPRTRKRKIKERRLRNLSTFSNEIPTEFVKNSIASCKDENFKEEIDEHTKAYKEDDILNTLQLLKENYGAYGTVLYDEENNFRGLYFTTSEMLKTLKAWHDVISIWSVNRWLMEDYCILLVSIKDSNGLNDVVAVGILEEDDKGALNWFINILKTEIDNASLKVKYIFGEKHLVESELKSTFPGTTPFIALNYSLKLFQKIVNSENFNITAEEREICLDYFTQMVYSRTLAIYNESYKSFCKNAPKCVVNYFDEDWAPNKNDWSLFNMLQGSLVDTINKVEYLDNRLKQIIPKGSSLLIFIKQLFKWFEIQKNETNQKLSSNILKTPDDDLVEYSDNLTEYAYFYISHQMNMSKNVRIIEKIDDSLFVTEEDTALMPATSDFCECRDWVSMMLPCRHIFAVRKEIKMNFFSESLCDKRWTRKYYLEHRGDYEECSDIESDQMPETDKEATNSKNADRILNQLIGILNNENDDKIEEKLLLLEDIVNLWNRGCDVKISQASKPSNRTPEKSNNKLSTNRFVNSAIDSSSKDQMLRNNTNSAIAKKTPRMTRRLVKFDLKTYGDMNVPLKFSVKPKDNQMKMILSWVVLQEKTQYIDNPDYIFDLNEIETQPNCIQHSILHEWVDLDLIKTRVTEDAYDTIAMVIHTKRENELWLCFVCESQLDDDRILCASCLLWFHQRCVGVSNPHKRKPWFCYSCVSNSTGTQHC